MTREDAKDYLSALWGSDSTSVDETIALEMAIKALEQEQYYKELAESYGKTINKLTKALEQQPCEDCISRQAALDLKIIAPIAPVMNGEAVHYEQVVLVRDLEKLPSVEPERKPGKWIHMVGFWECNHCHATYTDMPTCMGEALYGYCPMCGADMTEVQDEIRDRD